MTALTTTKDMKLGFMNTVTFNDDDFKATLQEVMGSEESLQMNTIGQDDGSCAKKKVWDCVKDDEECSWAVGTGCVPHVDEADLSNYQRSKNIYFSLYANTPEPRVSSSDTETIKLKMLTGGRRSKSSSRLRHGHRHKRSKNKKRSKTRSRSKRTKSRSRSKTRSKTKTKSGSKKKKKSRTRSKTK